MAARRASSDASGLSVWTLIVILQRAGFNFAATQVLDAEGLRENCSCKAFRLVAITSRPRRKTQGVGKIVDLR